MAYHKSRHQDMIGRRRSGELALSQHFRSVAPEPFADASSRQPQRRLEAPIHLLHCLCRQRADHAQNEGPVERH